MRSALSSSARLLRRDARCRAYLHPHPAQLRPGAALSTSALVSRVPAKSTTARTKKLELITQVQKTLFGNKFFRLRLDGKDCSFSPLFMRDSCQCSSCVDPHSGQKNFETKDIPKAIGIRACTKLANGSTRFLWRNDHPDSSEDHATDLPIAFFHKHATTETRTPSPAFRPWNSGLMSTQLRRVSYKDYMGTIKGFETVLGQLRKFGLVIVKDVPEDEVAVEHIAEKIGPLRNTFYGRTWDVKDKPKAENVAYTSKHLGLHMDLLYMKNPPGLQLLHCITPSATGGTSIFADTIYAANIVQSASAEHYEALARFPVTYHYEKGDHHFEDSKPVIEFSLSSEYSTRLGSPKYNVKDISAVNWSPPFQGPFKIDNGVDDFSKRLREWHEAAVAFGAVVEHPESLLEYQLKKGECVIFNNRRVLHGRTAFKSSEASETPAAPAADAKPRWLKGAYVDMDDFWSKTRVMDARFAGKAAKAEAMKPSKEAEETSDEVNEASEEVSR